MLPIPGWVKPANGRSKLLKSGLVRSHQYGKGIAVLRGGATGLLLAMVRRMSFCCYRLSKCIMTKACDKTG